MLMLSVHKKEHHVVVLFFVSVYFCERLLVVAAGGLKIKEDAPILTHPLVCCLPFSPGALLTAVIDLARQ
jgi:hypothetical protein